MPDTDLPSPAGTARSSSLEHRSVISAESQSRSRYVVERCPGGGGRAVYAVLDVTRIVTRRVICRTNFEDATRIAEALALIELVGGSLELMHRTEGVPCA